MSHEYCMDPDELMEGVISGAETVTVESVRFNDHRHVIYGAIILTMENLQPNVYNSTVTLILTDLYVIHVPY